MAATYKGLLTNNGKALIASATLNNKINYSHIAVGDGNGSVPNPLESRTALVNEKARIALNVVEINPNNTNQIICEAIIPSNLGGFYIRELGLYAGTTMVVNASYPPTYKPLVDEGGAREIAIKLVINIQNSEVIALYLDDSLIYATRAWVDTNYIRRNELVDNLTTDDASKPLSAAQGKILNDQKLNKDENAVGIKPINNHILKPSEISLGVQAYFATLNSDNSAFFCDFLSLNGWVDASGGLKNALVLSKTGQSLHHYQAEYASQTWTIKKQIAYIDDNVASSTKLKTPRNVFGQTFDGSGDVGGTITASTGLVQASAYHFIDMGRYGLDRMSFYNYGATFNFIDSENGNVVARITQNGIDCNSATTNKLKTPRNIALAGAVSGNANFDGSGNVEIVTSPNTNSLRVVEGNGYTITYDDARRIAIVQMTLWTDKSVVSQTLYETLIPNRHQIYSLPIMLKKRISADVQLSEEGATALYAHEAGEWLKYVMPDGYRSHDATSKLFTKFVRWSGSSDEPVSAIATVVGIF